MAGILEELSPLTVGAERLRLSLADPLAARRAFAPIQVDVDYSECEPAGAVLPLEMIVTGPSRSQRRLFRRTAPSQVSVLPDEGGRWIVVLREVFHNRWWGRLAIEVEGEDVGR